MAQNEQITQFADLDGQDWGELSLHLQGQAILFVGRAAKAAGAAHDPARSCSARMSPPAEPLKGDDERTSSIGVIGAIHINTIEGFWSLIKRGIMGSYHKVSREYLPLYVAEFQFRYNNRENADIFGTAISGC